MAPRKTLKGRGINRLFGVAPTHEDNGETMSYQGTRLGFSKTNRYPIFTKDNGKTWKYLFSMTDPNRRYPVDETAGIIYTAYTNPMSRLCFKQLLEGPTGKQAIRYTPNVNGKGRRKTKRRS